MLHVLEICQKTMFIRGFDSRPGQWQNAINRHAGERKDPRKHCGTATRLMQFLNTKGTGTTSAAFTSTARADKPGHPVFDFHGLF
jgi:hypothetical protein